MNDNFSLYALAKHSTINFRRAERRNDYGRLVFLLEYVSDISFNTQSRFILYSCFFFSSSNRWLPLYWTQVNRMNEMNTWMWGNKNKNTKHIIKKYLKSPRSFRTEEFSSNFGSKRIFHYWQQNYMLDKPMNTSHISIPFIFSTTLYFGTPKVINSKCLLIENSIIPKSQ